MKELLSSKSHSDEIVAIFRNVPDPWISVVATFVNYFKIAHLNSRNSKIRNFKGQFNGIVLIIFSVWAKKYYFIFNFIT